ncbi:LysR family transcriptional regulator [Paraburkholderia fungorum]|jgi:DNA-binding transcriptional LysR family regulator|uniref:LysR substrate-binding domain-containing protein n=1 Tax=Paraburkholderia fungorum TaxID=134537 RepID=UPI0038BCF4F7
MNLSFRMLELLRFAIETRSVTATAERLHISQPAVSKTLQQAEERLGFPLFVRERGRLVPTLDARLLLPEIVRATAAMEAVSRRAEDLQSLKTGMVTLAATPVLGNTVVTQAIAAFRAQYANVHVIVETISNQEVVEAVADHRVDLGVVLTPVEDAHTQARHLCTAELVCVLPETHVLAGHAFVGPQEVAPFPLISFNRHQPIGALIEEAFRAASIRRTIAVEVAQSWMACALVQAGAGLAIMDAFTTIGGVPAGLTVRPFKPTTHISGRLLHSLDRPLSRHAEAFTEVLLSVVQHEVAAGRIIA